VLAGSGIVDFTLWRRTIGGRGCSAGQGRTILIDDLVISVFQ
jgi:hypothetical protein